MIVHDSKWCYYFGRMFYETTDINRCVEYMNLQQLIGATVMTKDISFLLRCPSLKHSYIESLSDMKGNLTICPYMQYQKFYICDVQLIMENMINISVKWTIPKSTVCNVWGL